MNPHEVSGLARIDALAQVTLDGIRERGTFRRMRELRGAQGPRMLVDGREVAHFAGSNYLDLAHHPEVVEAAAEAARAYGCAVGGSRLICGNLDLHEALEAELAEFLGVQAALVFSSGYMANLGVLPSLLEPGDIVLSDALNHASIVDACRLSRAEVRVFPHGDVAQLTDMLREVRGRRVLVVLDGVYSMDGDLAPLRELSTTARDHGAIVMLDDAHGFGCLGERGRGTAELLGAEGCIDVYVGTLGKALGSFGAFVAGSTRLRELLINTSRTFIFTCALSAPQVAAARAGLALVKREPARRHQLQENAELLRRELRAREIDAGPSSTQIVPIVVGDNAKTMALCERLLARGYYAQGIRHPSVAQGTARLRVTLMCSHDAEQIRGLAGAIADELAGEPPP
ncbi:MAG TPA: 8-amino-7-oxononanoate synthase [Polyangiales bacterium]|nr:8-amino-7-oxononanoate synthase [Polyangiales bacterium]